MSAAKRDPSASVHARLAKLAREQGAEVELILLRYANERLLYRLCQDPETASFVLKGATRLMIDGGLPHRPTRDLDLLGNGESTPESLAALFARLCEAVAADEGLVFEPGSVRAESIREGNRYRGVRVLLSARLGNARLRLQVDIGFGDAVTPAPELRELPTLLDHPAPRMRVYPLEALVAEKLQILVELGTVNSRLKDYFDLLHLREPTRSWARISARRSSAPSGVGGRRSRSRSRRASARPTRAMLAARNNGARCAAARVRMRPRTWSPSWTSCAPSCSPLSTTPAAASASSGRGRRAGPGVPAS